MGAVRLACLETCERRQGSQPPDAEALGAAQPAVIVKSLVTTERPAAPQFKTRSGRPGNGHCGFRGGCCAGLLARARKHRLAPVSGVAVSCIQRSGWLAAVARC